ncbi:hypothetical protein C8K30_10167 [Promicromonospora sp. AC04]|nr:hypothetical protein C8K30_10167 [Promicromonospora sp. AC04]
MRERSVLRCVDNVYAAQHTPLANCLPGGMRRGPAFRSETLFRYVRSGQRLLTSMGSIRIFCDIEINRTYPIGKV